MTPTTDFLAGADRFDLDSVREQNDRGFPDPALQLPEVLLEDCVLLKLGLDVGKEALCLFRAVRENDLIVLVGIDRRVDGVLEGEGRALCVTTRGLDRTAAPVCPGDLFC